MYVKSLVSVIYRVGVLLAREDANEKNGIAFHLIVNGFMKKYDVIGLLFLLFKVPEKIVFCFSVNKKWFFQKLTLCIFVFEFPVDEHE
jgi:hypothetical protein